MGDHDTLQILLLPIDKSLVEYSAQLLSKLTVLRGWFNIETQLSAHPVYLSLSRDSQNKHR